MYKTNLVILAIFLFSINSFAAEGKNAPTARHPAYYLPAQDVQVEQIAGDNYSQRWTDVKNNNVCYVRTNPGAGIYCMKISPAKSEQ